MVGCFFFLIDLELVYTISIYIRLAEIQSYDHIQLQEGSENVF